MTFCICDWSFASYQENFLLILVEEKLATHGVFMSKCKEAYNPQNLSKVNSTIIYSCYKTFTTFERHREMQKWKTCNRSDAINKLEKKAIYSTSKSKLAN